MAARTSDRALTVPDVAERFAISKCEVYALIRSGKLAAFKVGRVLRIRPSAIDDFERANQVQAATAAAPIVATPSLVAKLPYRLTGRYTKARRLRAVS